MTEGLMDSDPTKMLTVRSEANMATWTHEKRKDFVHLFSSRSSAAQYILRLTANVMAKMAHSRKFISDEHISKMRERLRSNQTYGTDVCRITVTNTARDQQDLGLIAEQRAKNVIAELPPLRTAVQIIDTITARKIDQVDKLKKQGQVLTDELVTISPKIDLADVDQNMTIDAFRQMIRAREDRRRDIANELEKIGRKGSALQADIDKALAKGLPGISEAVMDAIVSHVERAVALEETTRRVSERVQFGDCEEAMGVLSTFEKDELDVPDRIRTEFAEALVTLGLSKKRKKALPKKSK